MENIVEQANAGHSGEFVLVMGERERESFVDFVQSASLTRPKRSLQAGCTRLRSENGSISNARLRPP